MTTFMRFVLASLRQLRELKWVYDAAHGVSGYVQFLGGTQREGDAIQSALEHLVLAQHHQRLAKEAVARAFHRGTAHKIIETMTSGLA